jgi:tetratricopeptide (TPR) repeat protein
VLVAAVLSPVARAGDRAAASPGHGLTAQVDRERAGDGDSAQRVWEEDRGRAAAAESARRRAEDDAWRQAVDAVQARRASGALASPRAVDLPAPGLAVTVAPAPLGVVRPRFRPAAVPPVLAPVLDAGGAPLPRFDTALGKPRPVARDPGALPCALTVFRRAAALRDCAMHRMLQGDLREARELFMESVVVEPFGEQVAATSVWLGELALGEAGADPRLYDEARSQYRRGLALGPPPELAAHAALGVGWVALRRGDLAEARRALALTHDIAAAQPVALHAAFLEGVIELLSGHPEEALVLWDGVAAGGPSPPLAEEMLFWQSVALARLWSLDPALEGLAGFLSSAWSTHPLRAAAALQAAWVALELGAADEAARRFSEAEGAGPPPEARASLLAGLVRVRLALGDAAGAAAAARRLAVESPRSPLVAPALFLVAEAAARRDATKEALEFLRQLAALRLVTEMADYVAYRLGDVLERAGRLMEAMSQFRRIRDEGRDEGIAQRATYRVGLLALREGDAHGARREGESLIKSGTLPELREPALLLTAEAATHAGDPSRAVAVLRVASREAAGGPSAAGVRLALGWALLGDGDPRAAIVEWQAAARTEDLPARTSALLAIAEAAQREGDEGLALTALRELHAVAPTHGLAGPAALSQGVLAVRAGPIGGRLVWRRSWRVPDPARRAHGAAGARRGALPARAARAGGRSSGRPPPRARRRRRGPAGAGLAALARGRLARRPGARPRRRRA